MPVYLREVWPTEREIQETMLSAVTSTMFREQYADVFSGDERWKSLQVPGGDRFAWDPGSTYIRNPPFFEHITMDTVPIGDIIGARVLALLGDSITTDHISPAGSIKKDSPAGQYLIAHGVEPRDFNSYGARRGNHEVMMRGTFANVRLRNQLAPGTEGGSPGGSTGRGRHATGPRRARCCSASRRCSPRASSAFTAATSPTWACCRCSTRAAPRRRRSG